MHTEARIAPAALCLALCVACGDGATASAPGSTPDAGAAVDAGDAGGSSVPNVVLLIADDLGVDSFGLHADEDGDGQPDDGRAYAPMPNIDAICREGVRFARAWSAPTCSPTRATILTGRFGFRTGVGAAVGLGNNIRIDEATLPRVLDTATTGYAHANIGKWHLGQTPALGDLDAPRTMGWSHFAGILDGALPNYDDWTKVVDGREIHTYQYATTAQVDDALAWLQTVPKERPWLLWLGFNAPHTPFHLPPAELHGQTLSGNDIGANPGAYYRAMIEALDTEIGRLLTQIEQRAAGRTVVFFVGDNGTPRMAVDAPYLPRRSKNTVYQGGVHVPLCASGPGVRSGVVTEALAHTVDLFATILDLAGVNLSVARAGGVDIDSVSLAPILQGTADIVREYNYTELFGGSGQDVRAVRDARHKLIRYDDGSEELYDLDEDPREERDLLVGGAPPAPPAGLEPVYAALGATLDSLRP